MVRANREKGCRAWRTLAIVASLLAVTCGGTTGDRAGEGGGGRRVIILGFDGMDDGLTRRLMSEGRLPNLQRLSEQGGSGPLATSIPPQSPVAWSSFITGLDPGGHGIFDFMHRDPETLLPYLSTSRTEPADRVVSFGGWQLPLSGGRVELLRRGRPFWDVLERHGIDTTIIRMPANFPPSGLADWELSGMGTPDLIGSYGTFSSYASDRVGATETSVAGGRLYGIQVTSGVATGRLVGPPNPFRVDGQPVTAEFTLAIDPDQPAALLTVGDEVRVLRVGEWTDWVPVRFPLVPTQRLDAICRFHLQEVRPNLRLYVSPLNLDPMAPALPVSSPGSFAADLARRGGRYFTQGMPEDTKALAAGILTPEEFLAQARLVGEENIAQYKLVLDGFTRGLLFYYFGNLDQVSHMMWRPMDPDHPAYDQARDAPFADVIPRLYERYDEVVGYTLEHVGQDTTMIVMSDHGFTSWRRSFNLNAWLAERGYLVRIDDGLQDDPGLLTNVDWARTRAYGVGLNGLYVNLRGRERRGIVLPAERDALLDRIGQDLLATIDAATGSPAVTRVYRPSEDYPTATYQGLGPDLIVGYAKGTRCSNGSALGATSGPVLSDNTDAWSGDHCMDHTTVPGILFSNRPLEVPVERLQDLGAAVLAEFGLGWAQTQD